MDEELFKYISERIDVTTEKGNKEAFEIINRLINSISFASPYIPTKVLYCNSYGGYGLSKECLKRYHDKGGPIENKNGWDISRSDPILIQVVEEMFAEGKSDEIGSEYCTIAIAKLNTNIYNISEYDGLEKIIPCRFPRKP